MSTVAKYKLEWFDGEQHTAKYNNWDSCQAALKRLIKAGMSVMVSVL